MRDDHQCSEIGTTRSNHHPPAHPPLYPLSSTYVPYLPMDGMGTGFLSDLEVVLSTDGDIFMRANLRS
jgi:hypothetical protein